MSVTVYGVSDDLIEVEGDITAEFSYPESAEGGVGVLLAFSDGTVMRVTWMANWAEGGVWRITEVTHGAGTVDHVPAPEDDEDNYSDRATLHGHIRWVVLGTEVALAKAAGKIGQVG